LKRLLWENAVMLKLGRAQQLERHPITEYEPKRIKCHYWKRNASKEQGQDAATTFRLKELPKNLDSTDGLAAAVCHFFNSGKVVGTKSYTGWDVCKTE
jgi:crossover junction endodeoxyribonuclease RuvC